MLMIRKHLFVGALVLASGPYVLGADPVNGNPTLGQEYSKSYNVIQTPVPFLNIAPDSRAGAMGDLGAATSPDLNSLHWNPAKYAFLDDNAGVSTTYSPWLKNLAPDIKLLYLTGFKRVDKQQTVAFGLRYFTLGSITFTDENNQFISKQNPNEFTLDASYARLFSEKMSGGITFRYIVSDLAKGSTVSGQAVKAGTSFAADISMYYRTPIKFNNNDGEWALGVNISNIGTKISYTEGERKDFIPTNLRIGTSVKVNLDNFNSVMVGLDLNKLLVPTPPIYKVDSTGNFVVDANGNRIIEKGMDPNVSVGQGIIQSFYDAPGGFSEELKEIMLSIGAEYWYMNQFAIRAGYFNEAAMKGNRKYASVGVGLRLTLITLDFSYLIPRGGRSNPLANTVRITASVDIGNVQRTKK
ncbi:MAG: type IX secretion system outer membrane channel protein PorV [Bacteroidales bacterium]